jgi:ubiquinol-cytochrome c reductase cytochrome b subunit
VIPHLKTFVLIDSDLNSFVWLSRFAALYYFAYFLVVMPVLGLVEKPLPVPDSIASPALSHPATAPAEATAAAKTKG